MGVHLTDLLISMLGPIREIRAISARRVLDLPSGDVVSTQFTFGDGTMGTINVISATPFYGRLTVFGTKAWVDIHEMRSEEHTSELQSLMRISYAVFCLKKKKTLSKIHSKGKIKYYK